MAALVAASAVGAPVRMISEVPLGGPVAGSQDVRWDGDAAVVVAAGTGGVFRVDLASDPPHTGVLVPGGTGHGRSWFATRVALSNRWLVAAAPVYSVFWAARAGGALAGGNAFDVILDVDARGDRIAVLGARRTSMLAPDGVAAWVGSPLEGLGDAHPVYYAGDGPGADALKRCGRFGVGAIRFAGDDALIIVPGFETGIFRTDLDGRVRHVWESSSLGLAGACDISHEDASRLGRSPDGLDAFVNRRAIVDDVVSRGTDPVLLVRRCDGEHASWRLLSLDDAGVVSDVELPVAGASASARAKCDLRGDRLVVLVSEPGPPARPRRGVPRLVTLQLESP